MAAVLERKNASRESGSSAARCRRKFLRFFPGGFRDAIYHAWERDYKWTAHQHWVQSLDRSEFNALLRAKQFSEVALRAVRIESRTNLLFSFEKMALRDALRPAHGAEAFATGLFQLLYGKGDIQRRFEQWCEVVESLPRKQTRVLTWPVVSVFGFLAQPETHLFLKPNVTREAARQYGFAFDYQSRPNWGTYSQVLDFAATIKRDLRDMRPRDMIDIQSFIWMQGLMNTRRDL